MLMPELRVLDLECHLRTVLDAYSSFQGERRLWEVGGMELHIGYRNPGARDLSVGTLVMLDPQRVWMITGLKLVEDRDLKLVATGCELKGILGQRVVIPGQKDDLHHFGWDRFPAPDQPDAAAESVIKHYVSAHAVNATDPKRRFPRLDMALDQGRGPKMRWSERFKGLDACLCDIGEYTGMGYTIGLDLAAKRFLFDVIPEQDQTAGSARPVIFATDYENLDNLTYTHETKDDVTLAYAGGGGTDEARLIQSIARSPIDLALEGFDRRETWLDCGSCQTADDLTQEAHYQMAKLQTTLSLTCSASHGSTFAYLRDWDLGSIVTVKSNEFNLIQNQKISGVKEVYERGKIQVLPTLGKRSKNVLDEITKRQVVQ